MNSEALVAYEFISSGLALCLAYFFFNAYRTKQSIFLLGLPVGFSFLSASYFFLGMFFLYESNVGLSQVFMYLRLILQSYGFAFIAFSYYFSTRTDKVELTSIFFGLISFISGMTILSIIGAFFATPEPIRLLPYDAIQVYFCVGNLFFLGYIVYSLLRRLQKSHRAIPGFVETPLGFSIFWIGKLALLIWSIDGSQTAFIFSHGCRLAALSIFIYTYYASRRIQP